MSYDIEKQLKGKKISEVRWNKEDGIVVFVSDESKEQFMFQTYGDCCSSTWLEQIKVSTGFRDAVITEVAEESSVVPDLEHECLQVYVVTLTNANGDKAKILFKNSSNGYYGGSLESYYTEEAVTTEPIEAGYL